MDDDVVHSIRRVFNHTTRTITVVVPMIMLVWITYSGYKLTTTKYTEIYSSSQDDDSYDMALLFGVVTVIFGLIYFINGVFIVAEMGSEFLVWLRQDDTGILENREKEQLAKCRIFVHTVAVLVSVITFTWTAYYGYRLALEPRVDVVVDRLAFLIGVISMGFGFIYFVIGISTLARSVLLQSATVTSTDNALLERSNEVKLLTVLCES